MNLMLLGAMIGLLPVTIGAIIRILLPNVVLPARGLYFLTWVFIPITFALAAVRREKYLSG